MSFHFLRPEWLLALLLIPALLFVSRHGAKNRTPWNRCCDPHLLPHLLPMQQKRRHSAAAISFPALLVLMVLALAGPAWDKVSTPVHRSATGAVILLDLSRSMLAQDIRPSRLERVKFKIRDLLRARTEGETGLIVFAGSPYRVTPLTRDTRTPELQLDALAPEIMPDQGTNHLAAIEEGTRLLANAGKKKGVVLIVTDSVPEASRWDDIRELQSRQKILFYMVGTAEGAPIPISGGYLRDDSGDVVIPRLNHTKLNDFARATRTEVVELTPDDRDIRLLLEQLQNSREFKAVEDRQLDRWKDRGAWLLLPALLLLLPFFRRGALWALIALLSCMTSVPPSHALELGEIFASDAQKGAKRLHVGDAAPPELFEEENWKAAAHFRRGEFEQAAEIYARSTGAEGRYNLGNSLAHLGRLEEAAAAYREALQKAPEHADAKHNLDLVEEQLQKQQQNRSESPEQNQGREETPSPSGAPKEKPAPSEEAHPTQEQQGDSESSQKEETEEGHPKAGERKTASRKLPVSENPTEPDSQQTSPAEALPQENLMRDAIPELEKVPDDPAGLLRRKFLYQYQNRSNQPSQTDSPW